MTQQRTLADDRLDLDKVRKFCEAVREATPTVQQAGRELMRFGASQWRS